MAKPKLLPTKLHVLLHIAAEMVEDIYGEGNPKNGVPALESYDIKPLQKALRSLADCVYYENTRDFEKLSDKYGEKLADSRLLDRAALFTGEAA